MKMNTIFMLLLCSTPSAYSMDSAGPDMIDPFSPVLKNMDIPGEPTKQPQPSAKDISSTLIKACLSQKPTPALIGFLLGSKADVNKVVDNTTALIVAVENPITENDPYLLEMLLPHATPENQAYALRKAVEMEKWNTVTFLQNHEVALAEDDLEEPSPFDRAFEWIKHKASAAKAGIARTIKHIRAPSRESHDNDDQNDLIAQTEVAAEQSIHPPLNQIPEIYTPRELALQTLNIEGIAI